MRPVVTHDKKTDENGVSMEMHIDVSDIDNSYKKFFNPQGQELSVGLHVIKGRIYEVRVSSPVKHSSPPENEATEILRARARIKHTKSLVRYTDESKIAIDYSW